MSLFGDNPVLPLLAIAGAVVLGIIVWGVLHPASDIRITVNHHGVHFRGRLPPGFRPDAAQLLREEMGLKRAVIYGNWAAKGVLKVTFRGEISELQKQRIRNYLAVSLRR